ncbi:MAG: hypothetical protein JF600_15790 [Xanthomonadales bacterium]|nr:hypothetical protein [Xanthomonadales bacterium]
MTPAATQAGVPGMIDGYRYTVSLRIRHPHAHPDRFTAALGLPPDGVDVVGQPRVRRGRTLPAIAKTAYWYHVMGHDPALDVAAFLAARVRDLSPHRALFEAIAAEGGRAEFFIGFFPEAFDCGFDLSPALQRACGDLHLSLGFDVYGYRSEHGSEDPERLDVAATAGEGAGEGALP